MPNIILSGQENCCGVTSFYHLLTDNSKSDFAGRVLMLSDWYWYSAGIHFLQQMTGRQPVPGCTNTHG